jgi:hypothetical protein
MNKVGGTLKILVDDMKFNGNLVANADEILRFETNLESKKIMNRKTMREVITDAYAFSVTIAARLEKGDLYGGVIDLSDEEYNRAFPSESSRSEES